MQTDDSELKPTPRDGKNELSKSERRTGTVIMVSAMKS